MSESSIQDRRASDILYDEIAGSRNSIRRENIRIVKSVCDQMEKDRVQIAAAEVVRRCEPDGPAYSTVCNTGSKLGEYIRLRIVEQASLGNRNPKSHSISETVIDPVLQAQIRDKESLARWLQKENDALRTLLKTLRPGVNIDAAIADASKDRQRLLLQLPSSEVIDRRGDLPSVLLKLMDHLIGDRQYCFIKGRLTVNKKIVLSAVELAVYRECSKVSEEDWLRRYELSGAIDG